MRTKERAPIGRPCGEPSRTNDAVSGGRGGEAASYRAGCRPAPGRPGPGKLIVLEGPDGSGKSTQAKMLVGHLRRKGASALHIREPGGTPVGERIRRIILDPGNREMCLETELLLYMASRAQMVNEIVIPNLRKGRIIVSERFLSSSIVYQGYAGGLGVGDIERIGEFATMGVRPGCVVVLDVPPEVGLARVGVKPDRIEKRKLSYHRKVRKGFLELAGFWADSVRVFDGTRGISELHCEIVEFVEGWLLRR